MKRTIIILLCATSILASCSKHGSEAVADDCRIWLQAGTVQTKSPYTATNPSESAPLNALVCVSTERDTDTGDFLFPSDGSDGTEDGTIGRHIPVQFQSGSGQLINGAYYNQNYPDTEVNFIALYPQSGWTFTDDATAEIIITGKDDIMFAPRVTGRYGSETRPQLTFSHLLTWLKIEISTDDEEVATAWGPVESITITSGNSLSIPLHNETLSMSDIVFSDSESSVLPLFSKDRPEDIFPDAVEGYTLTPDPKEVAYVLCAPVMATEKDQYAGSTIRTAEYSLNIESRHRSVTIPVDLMTADNSYFTGSTAGTQFKLRLNFKIGNTIAVSASVTDWSTGGIGIGKIEE